MKLYGLSGTYATALWSSAAKVNVHLPQVKAVMSENWHKTDALPDVEKELNSVSSALAGNEKVTNC